MARHLLKHFEEQFVVLLPRNGSQSPDIHNCPRVTSVVVHWRVIWLPWRANVYSELTIEKCFLNNHWIITETQYDTKLKLLNSKKYDITIYTLLIQPSSSRIHMKTHYVGKALRRLSAWDPGCGGPSTPIRVGHPWAAARCAALVQRFSQWPVKKYFFSNRCKSQNKHQNWILQLETNKSSGRTTEFHRV